MTARKKTTKAGSSKTGGKGTAKRKQEPETFPQALAALLRERKIRVPAGLEDAPPAAYARQPVSFVEQLRKLGDDDLKAHAKQVAEYARKQARRAKEAWDGSPLIAEIRRRKLKEPPRPTRVVGAAFSFKKPLREWSDAELLDAARQWSERGRD